MFIFSRERKQGVFAQQKAENCSFAQNRQTTGSPSFALSVVRDAKENREKKMAA